MTSAEGQSRLNHDTDAARLNKPIPRWRDQESAPDAERLEALLPHRRPSGIANAPNLRTSSREQSSDLHLAANPRDSCRREAGEISIEAHNLSGATARLLQFRDRASERAIGDQEACCIIGHRGLDGEGRLCIGFYQVSRGHRIS